MKVAGEEPAGDLWRADKRRPAEQCFDGTNHHDELGWVRLQLLVVSYSLNDQEKRDQGARHHDEEDHSVYVPGRVIHVGVLEKVLAKGD